MMLHRAGTGRLFFNKRSFQAVFQFPRKEEKEQGSRIGKRKNYTKQTPRGTTAGMAGPFPTISN